MCWRGPPIPTPEPCCKRDRGSGPVATTLLYAADLAERLEQVIVPALHAGLIVLADRYAYTPMARAEARGLDRGWLEGLFSFVVPPDLVLFLDVDPMTILQRRPSPNLDPYEAGADLRLSADALEGYRLFQDRLHRAVDDSAGRRVLADDLPTFLDHRPQFKPLAPELSLFFESSRDAFFGADPAAALKRFPARTLVAFGNGLAAAERGSP